MDDTLPDEAWKDSFDKLLDPIPILRELNIIKKNVRASFNIDSSVENSNQNISNVSEPLCVNPVRKFLDVGDALNKDGGRVNERTSISTPCAKRLDTDLFHCALSPITGIKLAGFKGMPIAEEQEPEGKKDTAEPPAKKRVCFEFTPQNAAEKSTDPTYRRRRSKLKSDEILAQKRLSIVLQPGKWRKSLGTWRRSCVHKDPSTFPKISITADSKRSAESAGLVKHHQRKSVFLDASVEIAKINYKKLILKYCEQRLPLRFDTAYASSKMLNTAKIGEGAYGEVFRFTTKTKERTDVVLKIIPIEGSIQVNGEIQKTYEQILPEIIISKEMCNLRFDENNASAGFVEIQKVSLVKGTYPQHLIKLWECYDDEKESENDHPKIFTDDQLFIVLELKFAGSDMSTFRFVNAEQSYYALQQIMLTLAVGEEACQFEHRDLHWGNVLIKAVNEKEISFKLNGKDLKVPSKGIQTTIIDYTLSRITFDECCHFNDLSSDEELFGATGDYQYDIYRLMRDELKNDWSTYAPKTNLLWLSYVNAKLIDGVKYRSVNTKIHKLYIEKLKSLQNNILTFESAASCVRYLFKIT